MDKYDKIDDYRIAFTLRIPKKVYYELKRLVFERQNEEIGCSINRYLNELIEKDLESKRKKTR